MEKTTNPSFDEICANLIRDSGISFTWSLEDSYQGRFPVFRPTDLPYPNSFGLVVSESPRRVSISFITDSFSGELTQTMGQFTTEQAEAWNIMLDSLESHGFMAAVSIDHEAFMNARDIYPASWSSFALDAFASVPKQSDREEKISTLIVEIVALLVCLLPIEAIAEDESDNWSEEGALSRISVNRYERSRRNRNLCLALHGHTCKVCDFDFERSYGAIGKNYVEVHHITPVSKMGGSYKVNPHLDLIPLCANCHRMIHKKNPPFHPEELVKIVRNSSLPKSPPQA